MASNLDSTTSKKNDKKMEKLTLIKERYKKLILIPRREIEFEIERDLSDDDTFCR